MSRRKGRRSQNRRRRQSKLYKRKLQKLSSSKSSESGQSAADCNEIEASVNATLSSQVRAASFNVRHADGNALEQNQKHVLSVSTAALPAGLLNQESSPLKAHSLSAASVAPQENAARQSPSQPNASDAQDSQIRAASPQQTMRNESWPKAKPPQTTPKIDVEQVLGKPPKVDMAEKETTFKMPPLSMSGTSKQPEGSEPDKTRADDAEKSSVQAGAKKSSERAGSSGRENSDIQQQKTASDDTAENKGGGGGPGGSWKRVQRPPHDDYRQILNKAVASCRADLMSVGIFSFILNLLVLAIPVYLFQVSDRVLTSSSVDTLIMLTVVVIGALAIYALLDIVRRYLLMRVAVRFETRLGGSVLSAAAKSSQFGSTREFQVLNDLQQIRNFMTGPVIIAMYDAPVAPIYFLAVYLIHPHLGIIVTVAALVLMVIAFINQRATAVSFSRANAFAVRAGSQAEAMARNAQIVNAMGMIQEGVMHWGRETAAALKAQVAAQDRNVQFSGLSKFIRLTTQVLMLGWGAFLAIGGELTGGMMIAASIIGSRALAPVEGLIEGWRGYVQARGGYTRIKTLLGNSPLNVERLTLPRPQGRLRVERVLYVPPPTKKVILNGIDFSLEPGETIAIVGPSGTGKSTLARMLVGSITPTSGSVRLDLMDIRNWDPRQLGETVGYLPQDVQLFPTSIKANIARLREDVSDEMIFDAAELAGVHEMISHLPQGYETQMGIDGTPLSGGQRQRLGLARAFFGDPRLVVLDEPNSNLDTVGEQALGAALLRAKKRGVTIVAVTQRPALLKSVDKILLLKEGKIQHLGPRDEVLPMLAGRRVQKAIGDAA